MQEVSSINELDLLAAIHGLRKFVQFARSRELVLVSDSRVTVHIVRNWTSRSPRLLGHLRTLRALCETHGVTLSTRHLPSALNVWADHLSRRRDSTSWALPLTSQLLLQRRFDAQLLDGNGLPPPRIGERGGSPLVLPRPSLLPVWHRHLAGIGHGIMFATDWPGQAWYQAASRAVFCEPLIPSCTPPWASVLFDYGRPPHCRPKLAEHWHLARNGSTRRWSGHAHRGRSCWPSLRTVYGRSISSPLAAFRILLRIADCYLQPQPPSLPTWAPFLMVVGSVVLLCARMLPRTGRSTAAWDS
jgi:hypothetical protein